MDGSQFDTLTRSLTLAGSRRRVLARLLGGTLASAFGAFAVDEVAAKKKCPPCKKRKQGKCKKKLPDGTACPGGTCQRGVCQLAGPPSPVGPCPGQKLCNGQCIPTTACCTSAECDGRICGPDRLCRDCREIDCRGGTKCCPNGACVPDAGCCENSECFATNKCCRGACIQPNQCCTDAECPGERCCERACVPISSQCCVDTDCGADKHCCNGSCIPISTCCNNADCDVPGGEVCCPSDPPTCKLSSSQLCTTDAECCVGSTFAQVCDIPTGDIVKRCCTPVGGRCSVSGTCCNRFCNGDTCGG